MTAHQQAVTGTPRTDAVIADHDFSKSGDLYPLFDLARTLERDLTAAREALEAKERDAGKLAGALTALRQCKPLIAPKDWPRYAQQVLDLADSPSSSGSPERGV